ncbi:hypothetical protein HDU97_000424 [Phlyctochytrium planicorne]|nr:hypothetical protein HDU97_000424 [Phlyctochytrium planicorne]
MAATSYLLLHDQVGCGNLGYTRIYLAAVRSDREVAIDRNEARGDSSRNPSHHTATWTRSVKYTISIPRTRPADNSDVGNVYSGTSSNVFESSVALSWGWKKYLDRSRLEEALQIDGSLLLNVEVKGECPPSTFGADFESMNVATLDEKECATSRMLLLSPTLADVELRIHPTSDSPNGSPICLPAHRQVLTLRSEYWRIMFTSGLRESTSLMASSSSLSSISTPDGGKQSSRNKSAARSPSVGDGDVKVPVSSSLVGSLMGRGRTRSAVAAAKGGKESRDSSPETQSGGAGVKRKASSSWPSGRNGVGAAPPTTPDGNGVSESVGRGEMDFIDVHDIPVGCFKAMLEYLYTSKVQRFYPKTREEKYDILMIADLYQLPGLHAIIGKDLAKEILRTSQHFNASEVLELLRMSSTYGGGDCTALQNICMAYAKSRLSDIKSQDPEGFRGWCKEADRDLLADLLAG